jgi:hypothetical protein
MSGNTASLIVHAVIGLALIGAATVLAWHGTIDAEAFTAILGTAVGVVGVSAGTQAAATIQQNSPPTTTAPPVTVSPSLPPAGQ